jgi:hypothetical protein
MPAKSLPIFLVASAFALTVALANVGAGVLGIALMAMDGNGLLFLGLGVGGLAFALFFAARVVVPFGRLITRKD